LAKLFRDFKRLRELGEMFMGLIPNYISQNYKYENPGNYKYENPENKLSNVYDELVIEKYMLLNFKECFKIADRYGGKVFGDFINEFINPKKSEQSKDLKDLQIDIWFASEIDADDFITKIRANVIELININNNLIKKQCIYNHNIYDYTSSNPYQTIFNIKISSSFII